MFVVGSLRVLWWTYYIDVVIFDKLWVILVEFHITLVTCTHMNYDDDHGTERSGILYYEILNQHR